MKNKKYVVIQVDWNNEASIKKAQRRKCFLENKGYTYIRTVNSLDSSSIIYSIIINH